MRPEARSNKSPEQTPGAVIANINTFFSDAEVGTPKFLALTDFLARSEAREAINIKLNAISENTKFRLFGRRVARMNRERLYSELRQEEMEYALINDDIRRKQSTMEGYAPAFETTRNLYNDLYKAYYEQAPQRRRQDINFSTRVDEQIYHDFRNLRTSILSNNS